MPQAIQQFCQAHSLTADRTEAASGEDTTLSATYGVTHSLHRQGLSPSEIALERGLRLGTIIEHLERLIEAGEPVELSRLVSPERQVPIFEAIEKVGPHSLRTIREAVGETFDYNEIRLLRAAWEADR